MSDTATTSNETDGQGYVTDVPYTIKYYSRQTPGHLALAARGAGAPAPGLDRPFAYADFGCGRGMTLLVLASVFPQSTFVGIDFNAEHVEEASARAKDAGLDNLRFLARSFDRLEPDDLPPLDFAAAHGVYSWVSPSVRLSLRDAMVRYLKPDGLAMVSYNVLAGYAAMVPLQDLMTRLARVAPGERTRQRLLAIDAIRRMHADGQYFFERFPKAADTVADWGERDATYLIHEYFNESWIPLAFAQVAGEMAERGLGFCGDAVYPGWLARNGSGARPAWIEDQVALEDLASVATAQSFRYDIYSRAVAMDMARQPSIAPETVFGLAQPPVGKTFQSVLDKSDWQARLLKLLTEGPQSFAALKANPDFDGKRDRFLAMLLRQLMAQDLVSPYHGETPSISAGATIRAATALGRRLIRDDALSRHSTPLPAPRLGGAVRLPAMVSAILAAAGDGEGEDLAARASQRVYALTGTDADGNKRESLERVRQRMDQSLDRYRRYWRPFLLSVGAIEPGPPA